MHDIEKRNRVSRAPENISYALPLSGRGRDMDRKAFDVAQRAAAPAMWSAPMAACRRSCACCCSRRSSGVPQSQDILITGREAKRISEAAAAFAARAARRFRAIHCRARSRFRAAASPVGAAATAGDGTRPPQTNWINNSRSRSTGISATSARTVALASLGIRASRVKVATSPTSPC
jgi:hypothetical protein